MGGLTRSHSAGTRRARAVSGGGPHLSRQARCPDDAPECAAHTDESDPRSTLQVLEIGGSSLFGFVHPEQTTRVWLSSAVHSEMHPRMTPWGWKNLLRAFRMARDPRTDAIVWHPLPYAPWDPRFLFRSACKLRLRAIPYLMKYGLAFLLPRFATRPLAVVDRDDIMMVPRHTVGVMKRALVCFKRELPADRWRLLAGTVHPRQPTPRLRKRPDLADMLNRVRPIPIGATSYPHHSLPMPLIEKTVDVFFAGQVAGNSTVRSDGIDELRKLEGEGYTIDIATSRLSQDEFYRRSARAFLVWSPEGAGWDCVRHYEVPLCGSVPLVNRPWIVRHQPLQDGEHCVFYDPESGGLAAAIRTALADKERLKRIAIAARQHVLSHHTRAALCTYILETLEAAAACD